MLSVKSRIAFMRMKHGVALGASSVLLASILAGAGCTVIQGDTAQLDNMKSASAQPAPTAATAAATTSAPVSASDTLATGSLSGENVASAGIPIPLISPRHRELQVASVDPRAGLGAIGVPIRQLAGVYLKFGDAMTIAEKSNLKTPKEVRRVLNELRFATPDTMAAGWYAIRAMTAAQNKFFAQGVRDEVRLNGQDKVLSSLDNPNYVLRIAGADAAVTDVMASVTAENERMLGLRNRLLETAQKFQRQKWGMIEPASPVKAAEISTPVQPGTLSSRFASLLSTISPIGEAEAYSPGVMTKILSLAARQVMSAPATVTTANDETASCLNWARLNLNQCIAAAHFPSEEAWCTGTHGIEEVRACWAAVLPASATMTPAAH